MNDRPHLSANAGKPQADIFPRQWLRHAGEERLDQDALPHK